MKEKKKKKGKEGNGRIVMVNWHESRELELEKLRMENGWRWEKEEVKSGSASEFCWSITTPNNAAAPKFWFSLTLYYASKPTFTNKLWTTIGKHHGMGLRPRKIKQVNIAFQPRTKSSFVLRKAHWTFIFLNFWDPLRCRRMKSLSSLLLSLSKSSQLTNNFFSFFK